MKTPITIISIDKIIKNDTLIKKGKNIMYLALGWAGGILCVLFYAYDYITLTYIAFFFAVAGFVVHHKESNK